MVCGLKGIKGRRGPTLDRKILGVEQVQRSRDWTHGCLDCKAVRHAIR